MALSLLCLLDSASAASSAASRPALRDGRGMDAHGVILPRLRNSLRSDSPRLSRNTPHASGKRGRSSTAMKRYGASGFSPDHVATVDIELRSLDVVPGGDNYGRSMVRGRHASANGGYAVLSPTAHIGQERPVTVTFHLRIHVARLC